MTRVLSCGALVLAAMLPTLAQAQSRPPAAPAVTRTAAAKAPATRLAGGALLRGLDKISGEAVDLQLANGNAVQFGRLSVRLGECRQPADDPESDAFAELTITDDNSGKTEFAGWMIASSPALSALDDLRYDIWVVACNDGRGAARPDLVYEPDTEPQPADAGEGDPDAVPDDSADNNPAASGN